MDKNERLTKRARVMEIDRLIDHNDLERDKVSTEINRLTRRRDTMLAEKENLLREQTVLLRELVDEQ